MKRKKRYSSSLFLLYCILMSVGMVLGAVLTGFLSVSLLLPKDFSTFPVAPNQTEISVPSTQGSLSDIQKQYAVRRAVMAIATDPESPSGDIPTGERVLLGSFLLTALHADIEIQYFPVYIGPTIEVLEDVFVEDEQGIRIPGNVTYGYRDITFDPVHLRISANTTQTLSFVGTLRSGSNGLLQMFFSPPENPHLEFAVSGQQRNVSIEGDFPQVTPMRVYGNPSGKTSLNVNRDDTTTPSGEVFASRSTDLFHFIVAGRGSDTIHLRALTVQMKGDVLPEDITNLKLFFGHDPSAALAAVNGFDDSGRATFDGLDILAFPDTSIVLIVKADTRQAHGMLQFQISSPEDVHAFGVYSQAPVLVWSADTDFPITGGEVMMWNPRP